MKTRRLLPVAVACCLLLGLASPGAHALGEHISHGRFKDVVVYKPRGVPKSFVLFLSGDAGWNAAAEHSAEALVDRGAMVAGIDTRALKQNLETDAAQCVFPDGDLENLSHFVQAYFHNPGYLLPMLVGIESGASLAYALLVQAPKDTFASALTVDFCAQFDLEKPLCKGSGLVFSRSVDGHSVRWSAAATLGNPWVDLQTGPGHCPVEESREFIGRIHGAAGVTLPTSKTDAALLAAFERLQSANWSARTTAAPAVLGDLPVIEVPAQGGGAPSDTFAIIISGDGGWAGIDQSVAAALTAKGIAVVGLDSLRYFWTARTPAGIGADIDKLIRYYIKAWQKSRVLLIGYSQGADVLPFAVNRLTEATRASVALTAILGMSEHALFEFHVTSWIADDKSGPLTMPEVERIRSVPVLCIYGQAEDDSLCPKLDPNKVTVVKVKGGHHFDGNYAELAQIILDTAAAPRHP